MAAGFALVALRLLDLQVLRRPFLVAKAERQQLRKVEVLAKRGTISDRHGQILAQSQETESVFLSPKLIQAKERDRLTASLSTHLGLARQGLRRKIDVGRPFWVKRGARMEDTAKIKEGGFGCLSFFPESRRVYPLGRLASHVLGFANIDGVGLDGVEKSYNSVLSGRKGVKEVAQDARGRRLPNEFDWITRPHEGVNVVLTIDAQFQHIAERELEKAWRKHKAKGAAMIVMDPRTGEILALASYPNFDPNRPADTPSDARRNRAISDANEPGSTFKAVTAALVLEQGLVTPDTLIDCNQGRKEYYGRIVRDHGDDHLGIVPFRTVLAQSSNVGTIEVAMRLGAEKLHRGMTRFGFGRLTGVDLPGEVVGTFRSLDKWTPSSMASVPYGQEISCTLMRMATVYASIANGGKSVTPHVVKEMKGSSFGGSRPDLPEPGGRVMSSSVRDTLTGMLENVVDEGTGAAIALPGYRIAGKTGTAQKFDMASHRYSMQRSVSSFVGFAPAEHPDLVAAVMLDEPQGMTLGGWTAGPVFRASLSAMLPAHGVLPQESVRSAQQAEAQTAVKGADNWTMMYRRGDGAAKIDWVYTPDLRGLAEGAARKRLQILGLKSRVLGAGGIVSSQFPEKGVNSRQGSTVTLVLSPAPKKIAVAKTTLVARANKRKR